MKPVPRVPPPPGLPGSGSYQLPAVPLVDLKSQLPPKDWPHAPVHRLADNAVYFVTASTLHKQHYFDTPEKRDLLERHLLTIAQQCAWQLEAWAVFANHYRIVARGNPGSLNLGGFLHDLHGVTSRELNQLDDVQGRQVWFNFRDTRLTPAIQLPGAAELRSSKRRETQARAGGESISMVFGGVVRACGLAGPGENHPRF
jgi:hypothetical protein